MSQCSFCINYLSSLRNTGLFAASGFFSLIFTELILTHQLHGVVAGKQILKLYPSLESLTFYCVCAFILSGRTPTRPAFPCKDCKNYFSGILKCDFSNNWMVLLLFPQWARKSDIIPETKGGNGLMTHSCFTHNFSGMLQRHPERLGCILMLFLWHGFYGAV